MKTLILAAIRCSVLFLLPTLTYATSAQWDLDPISGDWNTAENWTPNGVPNGPADIATFGLSNTSDISISANTEVNSIIFTPAATNPYSITVNAGLTLTVSGVGITNNSGEFQQLTNFGTIRFSNTVTAAGMGILGDFGTTNFFNRSTAGSAYLGTYGGTTNFFDRSTAGSAHIDSSVLNFFDRSTAGNSGISSSFEINFFDRSTAGNSGIFIDGISDIFASVGFSDNSTAGSAVIELFLGGFLSFGDNSNAGSAILLAEGASGCDEGDCAGPAFITFGGSSKGGTAQIQLYGSYNYLDISGHNAPGVTIGSLEDPYGGSVVSLGANNLTVGSNNLSTTFSGVIQDGDFGTGGSLTKIGTGTFILTGANTYTGDTNVNRGVLQVDGSITSNTFVNQRGRLAGTGTINGNLTNNGRVSPGSAGSPGMLTVTGDFTQAQYATLMIQLAGANAGEFSVLNILGTANLSGQLKPLLLNGFLPTVGESFTFLNYGAVNGTLFMFNRNIDDLPEHWEISYLPTFAVLTVTAGNVPVPDQASTFLLLMLGLSALLMCRRHCLRRFRTKRG
jgi:autotransporter-associated beta strand protein